MQHVHITGFDRHNLDIIVGEDAEEHVYNNEKNGYENKNCESNTSYSPMISQHLRNEKSLVDF